MATITFPREILKKLEKKYPLEYLKDRISMMDAVLERIDENEVEIEVFPSRPDLLSVQGFIRALNSFLGIEKGLRKYEVINTKEKVIVGKSLPKEWPYVVACVVKGIKFTDEKIKEVIQIQEKLGETLLRKRKKGGIGLYPLEKITFPVRFEGMDPNKIKFQPLEFPKVISGRQILSQHPTGKAYASICEQWKLFPVFIDAKNIIMSMPPIINSHIMGKVTDDTVNVFIEATGTDFGAINTSLNILVTALADMGGKVYSLEIIQKDGTKKIIPQLNPQKMKLELKYVNKRLGLNLNEKEAKDYLERMGFGYDKKTVLIPAYRADILHQVDLAEDIAIAYGYENFKEEIPNVSTIGAEDEFETFSRKIREVLIGLSLMEAKNIHLMTAEELNKKMGLNNELIGLKNALGDYNHLRNSLLPGLLNDLSENKHNEFPQNIFEIGRVFHPDSKTETGIKEKIYLAVTLCNDITDFTQIKQVLDALIRALDLEVTIKESKHPSFIPGRVGEIIVKGQSVGVIGELHPQVLDNLGLIVPAVALELDLEKVFELINNKK